MRDFTIRTLKKLYVSLLENGYHFSTYEQYIEAPLTVRRKRIVLRHDVDALPEHTLQVAQLEAEYGISASYYFRVHRNQFPQRIIEQVAEAGHEIGFHYESLARCKGNIPEALKDFEEGLRKLRVIYPVSTICMHGSPLSIHNNTMLWNKCRYEDYGIKAEVYLDTDFSAIAYLTDTGRAWNSTASLRDKVHPSFSRKISSTAQFIHEIKNGTMPSNIMLNIHPQRWSDSWSAWYKELIFQQIKNSAKKLMISQQRIWQKT